MILEVPFNVLFYNPVVGLFKKINTVLNGEKRLENAISEFLEA